MVPAILTDEQAAPVTILGAWVPVRVFVSYTGRKRFAMYVDRLYIDGFKRLTSFDLQLNPALTLIVGDNETGKSTVLEAVGLVLTGHYDGHLVQYAIDPYMFNMCAVADYFKKRRGGEHLSPPRILIEAYLKGDARDPALAELRGTNNSKKEDCPGLCLAIEVADRQAQALSAYAADASNPEVLPVEFYQVSWLDFAGNSVAPRTLPIRASMIDTSLARVYRGPNRYISQVVGKALSDDQRCVLSLAYKKLRHEFSRQDGVAAINKHLRQQGSQVTPKTLAVEMDVSARSSWESAITPHLDGLPFDCAGKGEQSRVRMRLAIAGATKSPVLLIEEPENHLSHSNLNMLLNEVEGDCTARQAIIATHSAFVLNKLGIDNLRLLSKSGAVKPLSRLDPKTKDYFMRLPGYDTLRLILSRRAILVEGASDELIVQRAYKDKFKKLPIQDGVDVISVGLAFRRFLELAALLDLDVRVVTDNDRDVAAVEEKYADYLDGQHSNIRICFDRNEEYPTLEPQLVKANGIDTVNKILKKTYSGQGSLLAYMRNHKTECALRFFETSLAWTAPDYVLNAIE
jgi:putative ATP-dependent endonuclease of OLD family